MKKENITNKELFDELKARGFFTLPTGLENSKNIEWIIVSVEEPERDIYYYWGKDYDKRKRGSGSDGN
ncbi:hypothetical protein [Epilithonimonas mollis]|uniref:Uncharacterized protein n=1 Tax=Epilithonimonas mollis TaxID=216903 RepID=A0A1M6RPH1_9FLAO|nr:hypothetical protein [Epilithonimonas mollis]SHK34343.1 hypothetical protein SAMN05444371_2011 [Epilithonimonas mollis]